MKIKHINSMLMFVAFNCVSTLKNCNIFTETKKMNMFKFIKKKRKNRIIVGVS